jgi:hypothetical protein
MVFMERAGVFGGDGGYLFVGLSAVCRSVGLFFSAP